MDYVGLGLYWNELEVGQKFRTVGRTVTEADIVNFTTCTGMLEVLFTDMQYIEEHSPTGRRIAPGALAYTFAEGLLVQATMQHTGLAFLNMELDVKGPVFAGDTIHVECEVVEIRPTSKGNRGLVRTFNRIVNQHDETVITYNPLRMMAGREKTGN
ncbi:MAG: MaoC/PaaZ C-terminal domain-containing protein [Alphaproteobacteria bacterium]|jgi:acyl dehydratase|nr:MaoC/PaaZ C-terminal domain-containing protein [Alphaproteobacteria bacterium]MDP6563838.1 MaoC/PaaZ C-terminal domain-containing protein [Alphaproteobacteria bacterium]MDP6811725.1 MaoC/PaaZ C-terminal domain-containing protein [Alphaproteobacteria bacterium]